MPSLTRFESLRPYRGLDSLEFPKGGRGDPPLPKTKANFIFELEFIVGGGLFKTHSKDLTQRTPR